MVTLRPDRDTLCAHRGCVGGLGGLGPQAAVLGVEGGDAVAQAALLRPAALRARREYCALALLPGGASGACRHAQLPRAGAHLEALRRGARLVRRQALPHLVGVVGA